METLYEYLLDNYKENEPIFLVDLQVDGMTRTNVRQQIKKLTDTGKVKRFDNGIYFLPKKTIFKSGSQLAPEKVLECKYLRDKDERCGYVSGLMFFNQMGLTTQVPMMYEVVSNKATSDYRETSLAKSRVIVRKPKVPVTEKNYKALQFLDMLKDVDVYSEVTGKPLQDRLYRYMDDAIRSSPFARSFNSSIKESVSLEPPAMTSFLSVLTFLKASTRYRMPFSGTRRPRNNMYESFFSPNLSVISFASRISGLFTPLGMK